MSLAGFKKQLNKANQYMSEKVGGAKGTELDDEFREMERRTDVLGKLLDDLIAKSQEYLQPNPVSRAKMSSMKTIQKIRGQQNHSLYPQPEGTLGDHMTRHGKDLGEEYPYGASLVEAGEAFRQLADIKYSLEDSVKQNFVEPLKHVETKDIKEINHHRKKLSGRRLDYDCKRRKQMKGSEGPATTPGSHISEEDIRSAEGKFEESKQLAESAMYNLLNNDTEQISQLLAFVESVQTYHRQALDIMTALTDNLQHKLSETQGRPRESYVPKSVSFRKKPSSETDGSGSRSSVGNDDSYPPGMAPTVLPATAGTPAPLASAKALYDFEPENDGELPFQEGDMVTLTSRIDENWLEGTIHGRSGYFPCNYVEIVVDLPGGGW